MALFLDARHNTDRRFRLWDTQTGRYVTGELDQVQMLTTVRRMLRGSGIEESANVSSVISGWLADAERRGTNDPKQKADPNLTRPWREGPEPATEPGELRNVLRARILAEQVARSVFDGQVLDWTDMLSRPARALITETFPIVHELMRGPGVATLRVERGKIDAVSPLIAEIAETWAEVVTIVTDDPVDGQPLIFTFRLL